MRSWPLIAACWLLVAGGALRASDNLVANGDFSAADDGHPDSPAHWDRPDGLGVQWTDAPGGGKAIRMDTRVSEQDLVAQWRKVGETKWDIPHPAMDPVAATYGLSLYSAAMPVEPGRGYRLSYDFQGEPGGVKAWVRGYGEVRKDAEHPVEHRRMWEVFVNGGVAPAAGADGWRTATQDVHPTKHTPRVTEMKVMLYAYWPPGVFWFRNVRLEPLPAEPARP